MAGEAAAIAATFAADCERHGFTWRIDYGRDVTITHTFEPGDNDAFVLLDTVGVSLGYFLPGNGSVFGTDGVGGHSALTRGFGQVHATGIQKRVLTALAKLAR